MTARYVHVEVRELRRGASLSAAEADCVVTLPTGERTALVAQIRSERAPFWRVASIEGFGDPIVERAIEAVGVEELCARIATAAALWNVWDAVRAKDAERDL